MKKHRIFAALLALMLTFSFTASAFATTAVVQTELPAQAEENDSPSTPASGELFERKLKFFNPDLLRSSVTVNNPNELILKLNEFIAEGTDGTEMTRVFTLSENFKENFKSTITLPSLHAKQSAVIDGNGATFAGVSAVHFNIPASNGTYQFSSMTLQGGASSTALGTGGVGTAANGNILFQDIVFENLNNYAISIHADSTGSLGVTGCKFRNIGNKSGGGIETAVKANTRTEISDSLFENINGQTYGSAVKWRGGNILIVEKSSFININSGNTADAYGGAIGSNSNTSQLANASASGIVRNSLFKNNKTLAYGAAIGLYQFAGTMTVENCYFEANATTKDDSGGDGGAIGFVSASNTSSLTVNNSTFNKNTAHDDAGAIFLRGSNTSPAKASVTNSTFVENKGLASRGQNNDDSGGAVQLSYRTVAFFTNNTFYKNSKGSALGGAIGHNGSSNGGRPDVTLTNNLFIANTGSTSSSRRSNNVNLPSSKTLKNNTGVDDGTSLPNELTVKSIFGTDAPVLDANGTKTLVGYSDGQISLPTLLIAPALASTSGIYADGSGSAESGVIKDQRGMARGTMPDTGSVDIATVEFNANGGKWTTAPDYSYTHRAIYVEDGTKAIVSSDYEATESAARSTAAASTKVPNVENLKNGELYLHGWDLKENIPGNEPEGETETARSTYRPAYGPNDALPADGNEYFAVWGKAAPVELTYHLNNGDNPALTKEDNGGPYLEGDKIDVKSLSEIDEDWGKEGFSFIGWAVTATVQKGEKLYNKGDQFEITLAANNLYARWAKGVTVTYDPNAPANSVKNLPDPLIVSTTAGSTFKVHSKAPTRDGYTFEGWKNEKTGTLYKADQSFEMPDESVTLVAQWKKTEQQVSPPNTGIEENSGSLLFILCLAAGAAITLFAVLKKRGSTRPGKSSL